jgi:hypothetical protein
VTRALTILLAEVPGVNATKEEGEMTDEACLEEHLQSFRSSLKEEEGTVASANKGAFS